MSTKQAKYKSGYCTICENHFQLLHWHHTVPRALGGSNSLQIPLCAQCHNQLHAHADGIVASQTSSRKVKRVFWDSQKQLDNALPYIGILVKSITSAKEHGVEDKMWAMQLKVPDNLHKSLIRLKQDSPLNNMEEVVLMCLGKALKDLGYYETDNAADTKRKSNSKGSIPKMW